MDLIERLRDAAGVASHSDARLLYEAANELQAAVELLRVFATSNSGPDPDPDPERAYEFVYLTGASYLSDEQILTLLHLLRMAAPGRTED